MERSIRIVTAKNVDCLCALEITNKVLQKWHINKINEKVSMIENLNNGGLPLLFDVSSTALEERLRVRASKANDKLNSGGAQKEKYGLETSIISIKKNEVKNPSKELTEIEDIHKSQVKDLRYKNINYYIKCCYVCKKRNEVKKLKEVVAMYTKEDMYNYGKHINEVQRQQKSRQVLLY